MSNTTISTEQFAEALASHAFYGNEIAVAVSGGADSMALLYLLAEWAKPRGIIVHALTIDHRLRPESAQEAKQVASWCQALSVNHATLVWKHTGVQSAVQEQARNARYKLMIDWCHAHVVRDLFTAHHRDDQIETFFFRLARGSGLEGLAGIKPMSTRQGITLHRPLLAFSKAQLMATLESKQQSWMEDPSNQKKDYTRNVIRTYLQSLSDNQRDAVSRLTIFFQQLNAIIKYHHIHSIFQVHNSGYGLLPHRLFLKQSEEAKRLILKRVIATISGDATPLRSEKIERLMETIETADPFQKVMMGGVVFRYEPKRESWVVFREVAKCEPPLLLTSQPRLWDRRFLVSLENNAPNITCRALGRDAHKFAKFLERSTIPRAVWPTLPALYRLEECMAIPHILRKDSGILPAFKVEFVVSDTSGLASGHNNGECARAQ